MNSHKKPRLIGLEFKLDGIPKDELESLRIGIEILDGKLKATIKTDNRTIPTNAVKGFKKEKEGFILKKIYHNSDSNSLEPNSFLEDIDQLYAIDTNSKVLCGNHYSVGVVAGLKLLIKENETCDIQAVVIDYLVNVGMQEKVENKNWKSFIESYSSNPINAQIKTGIIVDSDLGFIDQFNKKEIPIHGSFFLPENIKIIYASVDKRNDTIINKLIRFCDEESTKCLQELEIEIIKELKMIKDELIKNYPENELEINKAFQRYQMK